MDIEFKYGRKKRGVVMIVGVALAAAAFAGVLMTTSAKPAVAEVPMKNVVVAAADIAPRTIIDASMVTVRSVADDVSLGNVYADTAEIVGRMSAVQIYAQQPITPNLFANSLAGTAFSILEPGEVVGDDTPEWRAISVISEKSRSVGGLLEVGQHVDLILTVKWNLSQAPAESAPPPTSPAPGGQGTGAPPGTGSGTPAPLMPEESKSTKVTFQNVQLLAKDISSDIYIFKVNLHQAEQIAHVQSMEGSSFAIVLRPDGDYRPAAIADYGETTDRIVWQYNFPIPQFIELDRYPLTSPVPGAWDPNAAPSAAPPADPAASVDPGASVEPAPTVEPTAAPVDPAATPDPGASVDPGTSPVPSPDPAASPSF
jgi:Flp pilus assembly protein CpaB